MTAVRMKAKDTIHISSVQAGNLHAGDVFEVPGYVAEDLEKRGLAEPADEEKAEPAAQNKAEKAPANKAKGK